MDLQTATEVLTAYKELFNLGEEALIDLSEAIETVLAEIQKLSWIPVTERLPEIDSSDKWNSDNKITRDVLCYSSVWGVRIGRHFYLSGNWTIDGVTSTKGVIIDYWKDINPPV